LQCVKCAGLFVYRKPSESLLDPHSSPPDQPATAA
jgi:hypothetical protein